MMEKLNSAEHIRVYPHKANMEISVILGKNGFLDFSFSKDVLIPTIESMCRNKKQISGRPSSGNFFLNVLFTW